MYKKNIVACLKYYNIGKIKKWLLATFWKKGDSSDLKKKVTFS